MATLTTAEVITVAARGQTLERILSKRHRRQIPGLVERALDINPGLAALGPIIPLGTVVRLPIPTTADLRNATDVVQLWD